MIRDIRETEDPGVMIARGPRFDIDRVLAAGFGVLAGLVERIRRQYPDAPITARTVCGEEWDDFDDLVLLAMQVLCLGEQAHYDVCEFRVHVDIEPFFICLRPFGEGRLQWTTGGLRTSSGDPVEALDVAPELTIQRSFGRGTELYSLTPVLQELLSETGDDVIVLPQRRDRNAPEEVSLAFTPAEQAFLRLCLRALLPSGIMLDRSDALFRLRFDHKAFGDGLGDIRIEVAEAERGRNV